MFLALTLLNPITVTYFTTLILGMGINSVRSPVETFLFIFGVFFASLSWQSFLAAISGVAHKHLSIKVQLATVAVGNLVVIGLGIAILMGLPI
jgi:arginine exporter protein ArgO